MKKASLLVQSGSLQGKTCPIDSASVVLGRTSDCTLVLGGYERVSRHHAILEWNGQSLTIIDQNSTNGVIVNGHKVERSNLKNGDRLDLGDFSAIVQIEGEVKSAGRGQQAIRIWNSWPGTPPQKFGVAACAFIVLLLGSYGMRRQPTSDPFVNPPTVSDPSNTVGSVPNANAVSPPAPPVASSEPVNGRIAPSAIESVKAATVLIAHPTEGGYSMGSGFTLGDSKRIVTNRHVVVDDNGIPQDCLLIFEAGTPRERKVAVPASRITLLPQNNSEYDFQNDLASITLDSPQVPALPAGKSESLSETDEVYAVGFPLGIETLTVNGDLPSVSVKPARVERLQKDKNNAVTVIQLGSSVTHGNSGGPVVNNRGEVVGVISSGVEGTSMAYAIPMVFVNTLP